MPWGDIESMSIVFNEIKKLLRQPPNDDSALHAAARHVKTNSEKIALVEDIIIGMYSGQGGGMSSSRNREKMWVEFLTTESSLFSDVTEDSDVPFDADYAFQSKEYGVSYISHKSIGWRGGQLALTWGNNDPPIRREFESPILIVNYRRQTKGAWFGIDHGVYLVPLDYCRSQDARVIRPGSIPGKKRNNRSDNIIPPDLVADMLRYAKENSLFYPIPYKRNAGRNLHLPLWTRALSNIRGNPTESTDIRNWT